MKSLRILAAAGALASAFIALPAAAQTASLNFGTNSPVTCTFSGLTLVNGNLDVVCTTPATNTGTPTPGPYTLTVNILPLGAGTVAAPAGASNWQCASGVSSTSCTGTFASASPITLTATPATGYNFTSWAGATCAAGASSATCATNIASNLTMTASFAAGSSTPPPTTNNPLSATIIPAPGICGSAVGTQIVFNMGTTYSFVMPKTTSGAGQVAISSEGGVGTNAQLEVSFSKVPGDWVTAKATSQTTTTGGFVGFTQTIYPYYMQQGGYVSLPWQSSGTSAAVILPTEAWYVNLRMSNATGYLTVQISSPGCN